MAKVIITVKEGNCLTEGIKEANCPGEHVSEFGITMTLATRRCGSLPSPAPQHMPLTPRHFVRINSFPSEILAILMFNLYELKAEVILFPILFFIVIV